MDIDGPAYLRLGSGREPEVFPEGTPFEFGKIREVKSYGDDVAVFASGFIMNRAIEAVDRLHAEGVNATLIDVSTVKPLDLLKDTLNATAPSGCTPGVMSA